MMKWLLTGNEQRVNHERSSSELIGGGCFGDVNGTSSVRMTEMLALVTKWAALENQSTGEPQ